MNKYAPVRHEFVFTSNAVAELLRQGARHEIVDGLPHEYGEEPTLVSADLDQDGKLRLIFEDAGSDEWPPIHICKAATIKTIEEL